MPGEKMQMLRRKEYRELHATTVFISGKEFCINYILWFNENYLKLFIFLNNKAFICAA